MAFIAALPALAGAASASTATAAGAGAAASGLGWLGYTSLGLTALGGAAGAYGAIQSGKATAAAANYNAEVAGQNAIQAQRNQQLSIEAGEAKAGMEEQKTRAYVGQLKAQQAAQGIDVNSGSALDVRSSAAELGQLDALTVRSNAVKEAYGYQVQGVNFENQQQLDIAEGKNAETAGEIGAASTFLGAAGSAGSNFYRYQLAGGFTG